MDKVLIYSDIYMPVITMAVYLSVWKMVKKEHLFLFIYLVFNIVLFGIADFLSLKGIHNMPLFHVFSLLDVWFLLYYLLRKITGKKMSLPFLVVGILYSVFFVCNIIFWEDLTVFNSNSAGVSSLIILFLCMYYLLKLSKSEEILYFQRLPVFWITSGFLIYNAVSILVLLSYKYFTYIKLPNEGNNLWYVLSAAIIIKFALISIGLLCHRKQPATRLPFLL